VTDRLLEIKQLKKYFPVEEDLFGRPKTHVKAIDGVSLHIKKGNTLGLIGESGSGKSTLAKTVIGLHQATEGTIKYDGKDISDPTKSELDELRSKVQMVFQDPTSSLNPRRSIKKNIAVPLAARGVPKGEREQRVIEVLERVDLTEDYLQMHPHELSGGQKQRVNIARALSVEPEMLLLDEPTSALDVSVQAKIINLLEDLQNELGLTYLFITHDLSLIRNIADRTAVMYLGQIQERGETNEIFKRPTHPYTRILISSIPVTSDDEERYKPDEEPVEGEIPSPQDVPSGCRFHTRCPYATDVCRTEVPELQNTAQSLQTRCLMYDSDHESHFDRIPKNHDVDPDNTEIEL